MQLPTQLKELLVAYERRIIALEERLEKLEAAAKPPAKPATKKTKTEES